MLNNNPSSFNYVDIINASQQTFHALSTLLPYDPASKKLKDLPAAIKEYGLLLKATLETILALKAGKFTAFDPLVGENFCQARALMLVTKAAECLQSLQPQEQAIKKALNQIDVMLANPSRDRNNSLSLKTIIDDELEISLTADQLFFVMSFLLTVVKTENQANQAFVKGEKTDIKKLRSFAPVPANFANHLVAEIRKKLAEASVSFFQIRIFASTTNFPVYLTSAAPP